MAAVAVLAVTMPTAIADARKCGSGNHGRPNVLVIMTGNQRPMSR